MNYETQEKTSLPTALKLRADDPCWNDQSFKSCFMKDLFWYFTQGFITQFDYPLICVDENCVARVTYHSEENGTSHCLRMCGHVQGTAQYHLLFLQIMHIFVYSSIQIVFCCGRQILKSHCNGYGRLVIFVWCGCLQAVIQKSVLGGWVASNSAGKN